MKSILILSMALLPGTVWAQRWEVGGVGGGSFYTNNDVKRPNGTVQASFGPGYAAGAFIGQEMGRRWGGEVRYLFQSNEAQLKGNGLKASFGAQTHTVHYNFLLHLTHSGAKVRPFVTFGAGLKQFRGTGSETVTQPLSDYALLTKSHDTVPVVALGVGIKLKLGAHSSIRIEFNDYLSPMPSKVITPNRNSDISGWIHNFTPTVGISYLF